MCVFTERFLSDGDITVDIGITAAPVITANYIESYHKVCVRCIPVQIQPQPYVCQIIFSSEIVHERVVNTLRN